MKECENMKISKTKVEAILARQLLTKMKAARNFRFVFSSIFHNFMPRNMFSNKCGENC